MERLEIRSSGAFENTDQAEDLTVASLIHRARHSFLGQMQFVHRDGEVNVTFTRKTYEPSTHKCNLEGTVTDNDAEAGDLSLSFKADISGFSLIDSVTGKVIFEEHAGENDTQTLVIEDDNFVITGLEEHKDTNDTEDANDTGSELIDLIENRYERRTSSAIVHMGRGRMVESREAHWQQVIGMRLSRELSQQHQMSLDKFDQDLKELLSDKRDNAILELAVAFSDAGINGGSYPCAFPLLSLAQKLRENAKSMSTHTKQDVRKKEEESAALHGESLLAVNSSRTCDGCSASCGNSCFGLCGMDCNHWTFVCAPENKAYAGCCEHDGICSCGGLHWYECWSFQAGCSSWICAASRCQTCSACSGSGRRRGTRRRRWGGDGQTLSQAMGVCSP